MSFSESVIVPLSVFRKCNFEQETGDKILDDPDLPPSKKMMLFQREAIKRKAKTTIDTEKEDNMPYADDIIASFPEKLRPVLHHVFKFVRDNPEDIRWNKYYQVILENRLIPQSNIQEILHYIFKTKIVSSDKDIPIGADQFRKILNEIGVPKTLLPQERKSERIATKKAEKQQTGEGIRRWAKWKL